MTSARAAATADAIENAALDLALEHGYDHVTVDLICDKVGISQRTFFNHFPTKDDVLLGRDHPEIDERAARRFILADGPLLVDALSLFALPSVKASRRLAERMRVISTSPALIVRQMERIGAIQDEMTEIVALRLNHQHPYLTEAVVKDQASMVTHLLAGFMRWVATRVDDIEATPEIFAELVEQGRQVLQHVLRD